MEYSKELTKIEKDILIFLNNFITLNSKAPTLREIAAAIDNSPSPTTISKYLNNIAEKGYINIYRKKGRLNNITLKKKIFKDTKSTNNVNSIGIMSNDEINNNDNLNQEDILDINEVTLGKEKKVRAIKISEIPLISHIKEKTNLFSEINYDELIAVPVPFGKEDNLFAFKANNNDFKEAGMPKQSTIVVDKKQRLIPR